MENSDVEIHCLFANVLRTCKPDFGAITPISKERLQNVITCSHARAGFLAETILNDTIYCSHTNCLSTYTSKLHIKRHNAKGHSDSPVPERSKRISRGEALFSFQRDCIFCGERCELEPDKNTQKGGEKQCCVRQLTE